MKLCDVPGDLGIQSKLSIWSIVYGSTIEIIDQL